jgi:WhiB family transcriptional regulator, redox-sensing transcriptional regulator
MPEIDEYGPAATAVTIRKLSSMSIVTAVSGGVIGTEADMGRQTSYLTSFARTHCLRLPPPVQDAWNWQLHGNCLGYPLDVFFPENTVGSGLRRREEAAKQICRGCPVLAQRREHALRTPEQHGVWGAMTPGERARERLGPRSHGATATFANS